MQAGSPGKQAACALCACMHAQANAPCVHRHALHARVHARTHMQVHACAVRKQYTEAHLEVLGHHHRVGRVLP